ncbi:hypothetical protein ACFYZ4_35230 [Streptomyces sp. NPDC001513]
MPGKPEVAAEQWVGVCGQDRDVVGRRPRWRTRVAQALLGEAG